MSLFIPWEAIFSMGASAATTLAVCLFVLLLMKTRAGSYVGSAMFLLAGFVGMTSHWIPVLIILVISGVLGFVAGLIFLVWWVGLIVGFAVSILVGVIGNTMW